MSSDDEDYEDRQNIQDWDFAESDSEDEDVIVEDENAYEEERDFEPFKGLAHQVPPQELAGLQEDLNRPPVQIEDPEAALDDIPEDLDDDDEMANVGFLELPEISDVEIDFDAPVDLDAETEEAIPDEPPLDINPDDMQVQLAVLLTEL